MCVCVCACACDDVDSFGGMDNIGMSLVAVTEITGGDLAAYDFILKQDPAMKYNDYCQQSPGM